MKIDFDKIKDLHIICIGDIMLDEFVYGSVDRISPEAPIQVLKVNKNNQMLGGVGNVAANLLELGAKVTLFTQIGHDVNGDKLTRLLDLYPTLEAFVFVDKDVCTITKTRFLSKKQHILRVDQEDNRGLNKEIEQQVIENLKEVATAANVLVISDYNKGFVSPEIKKVLGELQILKILDSKGDLTPYEGKVDILTPNIKELEQYSGLKIIDTESLQNAVSEFEKKYKIRNVLVTASEKGMFFFEKINGDWTVHSEQSYNNNPVDVSGAGDTVMAALAIAMGLVGYEDVQQVLEFASRCAGIAISKSGTSTVSEKEIKRAYNLVPENYRSHTEILPKVHFQQMMGKNIGFINGCFDMFHSGHAKLLQKAKERCDYLVVAVNGDESIKKLKGEGRPIINEQDRCDVLKSNKHVDAVVIFDEDDPRGILKLIRPNVVFKGIDYQGKEMIEQDVLNQLGCQVEFLDTIATPTSKTIEKIKNQ